MERDDVSAMSAGDGHAREPIRGWEDLRRTSPAVEAVKKPGSDHSANRLGFHIDDYGLPVPFASMPSAGYIKRWREEHGEADYTPIVAADVNPGHFAVSDLIVAVHGITVVDFRVGGSTSRGVFRVTKEFMYGSAFKGLGAQWRNDAWTLGDMGDTARVFKWLLEDIASIEVHRTHKMFKLRDEEIVICGEPPPPGSKGEKSGVSVRNWLKGAQPEDITEVAPSRMRFGGLELKDVPSSPSDGSEFLGFAEYLAQLVAGAKARKPRWNVEHSGKDRTHIARFA
jgi:hypothetical protein